MKAKFIRESVTDVLKPKPKEEMDILFKEKMRMSWDKYLSYANQLKELGVTITELWSWRIEQMTIKTYKVYVNNWNFGTAVTPENARALMQTHKQYSLEDGPYHIDEDHAYLDIHKMKQLINKLRLKINQSTKYVSDDFANTTYKYDYPGYYEWYNKNADEIHAMFKKREEEKKKIEEGSLGDILKPKDISDLPTPKRAQEIRELDLDQPLKNYLIKNGYTFLEKRYNLKSDEDFYWFKNVESTEWLPVLPGMTLEEFKKFVWG